MAHPSFQQAASLTRRTFALGTAAFFGAAALLSPAQAGDPKSMKTSPSALPTRAISPAQCTVFGGYVADEADTFGAKLSATFLNSIARFVAADCATKDAKGEIHIITMTDQDAISMRSSLRRMGSIDVFGSTGVKHCANPPNGTCPAQTTSNSPRLGS